MKYLFLTCVLLVLQTSASAQQLVYYKVTFDATWSQATHPHPDGPAGFPEDPRFSPLVGAVHNANVSYWQEGQLATPGVVSVAETGDPVLFLQSVLAEVASGTTSRGLYRQAGDDGRMETPGTLILNRFEVSEAYPLVTLLTMIGPSPDWIVGVSGLSMKDNGGAWIDTLVVDLYPYDGGSEDGTEYSLDNPPTVPQQPITDITGVPPLSASSLGTFTFTRVPAPQPALVFQSSYVWNTGGSGTRTTTLYTDLTLSDSNGASGSWQLDQTAGRFILRMNELGGCGPVQVAVLIGPGRFQGPMFCTDNPAQTGYAAGIINFP